VEQKKMILVATTVVMVVGAEMREKKWVEIFVGSGRRFELSLMMGTRANSVLMTYYIGGRV
jgi:CO dehydrogenase/acetyl-CoA synthase epsilon subunit